jgi:uroporphyrinogen-III decarboxylase
LTFGWEIFLELAGGHKAELKRLMADFAQLSRKFFTAVAMTDVTHCVCHDDVCMARGAVCSPAWMREFVYPYYEEFWSLMKAQGIIVIFMTDGNMEGIADDIFACGADGIISEPFADYEAIAQRHPDKFYAGDGDNRVLCSGDRNAIERMTKRMCDLGHRYPGYMMCIGNHIPWNVPAESVKWYFEFSDKYGWLNR